MTREDAVRKVTALLRLAARPGTSDEGAAAVAKAQAIMDKFEIEQAALSIDGSTEAQPDEDIMDFADKAEGYVDVTRGRSMPHWRWGLAHSIAQANGCFLWISARGGRAIEIVGRPSQVETVRYMHGWLLRELLRLGDEQGRGMARHWKREFREGAVEELRERLRAEKKHVEDTARAEAASGSALVTINKAIEKVDSYRKEASEYAFKKYKLRPTKTSSSRAYNPTARDAGRAAARDIDLGRSRKGIGGGRRQIGGGS